MSLVPLPGWPEGIATAGTFDWIRWDYLEVLRRKTPVDARLLALHGALVGASELDVEGELLTAVRQTLGAAVPTVATLDLHGNITVRMIEISGALVLYHTAPYIVVFASRCI